MGKIYLHINEILVVMFKFDNEMIVNDHYNAINQWYTGITHTLKLSTNFRNIEVSIIYSLFITLSIMHQF